ncbi:MAG: hypothetical protein U0176_16625 [Bacteroidia bacterium]
MNPSRWPKNVSVKLLGKARAGNAESQQLELLDWINRAEADANPSQRAPFRNNLPTVSNRLKDLILDAAAAEQGGGHRCLAAHDDR